jgi:Tfp pilus assembly protein PilN
VLSTVFGFYLPLQERNILSAQVREKEEELQAYSNTQEIYGTLMEQMTALSQTDLILDSIESNNLQMSNIMDNIESNIPEDIMINEMSLESGMITLEGTSLSFTEIASFIVKLRNMESVLEVSFLSAEEDEASMDEALEDSSLDQSFLFTIYVKLNVSDILSQINVGDGTEEEAVQNETN